ncbi:hypothetical protein BDD12DRAFT_859034 [Trichophaea hybrida]|nr:hypothetical protein BDD12DRAFT_859034 [Trichophaea hybrida]
MKLSLFTRTMGDTARYDRRGDPVSKNVHDLRLFLDPTKEEGNRYTAAVLEKMVESVARYCPRIRIHLVLENATCSGQPITSFYQQTFPRVTSLILHTGPGQPQAHRSSTRPPNQLIFNRSLASRMIGQEVLGGSRDTSCRPNKDFWTGIFNGTSFPALEEVEIHHRTHLSHGWGAPTIDNSELKGLKNITRLAVDGAPELNGFVLMQALPCAPNLKYLELKNIDGLEYDVLAKLLVYALPNLNHFTLHVSHENRSAGKERDHLRTVDPLEAVDPTVSPIHLCPLIREHGKHLPHLDIFLPYVCRELFLSANERLKLNEAGVKTQVAGRYGEKVDNVSVDAVSIVNIITDHRKALSQAKFRAAVKENLAEAKKEEKNKIITMAEYEEQQKQFQMLRTIKREKWSRTVRVGKRLCRSYESWEELGILAGLGQEEIVWVLGNEKLNLGGTYTAGNVGIEKTYDKLFPAKQGTAEAARIQQMRGYRPDGYDHNDDMM